MARLFQHGQYWDSESRSFVKADVLVGDSGKIESLGADLSGSGDVEMIDCEGCLLLPGMFDLNVHGREPGAEHKETLASCAEAALHGGVTGVVLMPDTSPPVDGGNQLKSVQDLVAEVGSIAMYPAGSLSRGNQGEQMAGFSGMASRGVVMLADSCHSITCPDLLRRCMEYARDFDLLVATCCDTPALSKAGVVNEGKLSYRLGLPGIPAMSQEIAIDRNLRVAQYTGAKLHIQQVSTRNAVQAIAASREAGTRVSCEVSAHHLLLTEEDIVDYNTHFKLDPPLRVETDREALVEGLIDGTIDVIASNHAPHTEFEKSADFASAPFGAAGLETTLLAIYDGLIQGGSLSWEVLIRAYSERPREMIGQSPVRLAEGERAEFVVFDPEGETVLDREYFKTKSPVTPFLGKTMKGAIRECWRLDIGF